VSPGQKAEYQPEENQTDAMAGIEAHPTPPHGRFPRDDGGNLAHAELQHGIAGGELWSPEGVDEVDESEGQYDAGTEKHENSCGQVALPFNEDGFPF